MITVGSVFTGIGGIEYGLERTGGFKTVWQVEIDPFCRRVLEKHWPDVKRYGDIRKCHGAFADASSQRLEKQDYVDLICGGFPCQPFSHAGKRKGVSDSRWLWPEFYRIIREVRPKWVIVENVPGLLSIDSGRVFIGILRDFSKIGYDAEWFTLRASDFGAPHRRERVFIVAHSRHKRQKEQEQQTMGSEELCGNVAHTKLRGRIHGQLGIDPAERPHEALGNASSGVEASGLPSNAGSEEPRGLSSLEREEISEAGGDAYDTLNREHRTIGGEIRETESIQEIGREAVCGGRTGGTDSELTNSQCEGLEREVDKTGQGAGHDRENPDWSTPWIEVATKFCRLDDGLSDRLVGFPDGTKISYAKWRVEALKALGNAVVPRVAEHIGKMILNFEMNRNEKA